jgi:hypothetical protein
LDVAPGKPAEWKNERPIKRNLLRLSVLRPKELTVQNYIEGKQRGSGSVALGQEIGKEAIRLLIAFGGNN